ncbi:hypothetical protein GGX14DRAFT_392458 [Mycena pura]|uniref:Uncharacterized protein n=1 Tax=Mycena pura TaxID=153505 RepID=A0AAD6VIZ7_9AGAR|nr:hypothetical protein GGX14DRAFT_392458 [Mycena pura]
MLYHLVFLSLTALASAIAPMNGFFRITDFEGRSLDLHDRTPADFGPVQSFIPTVGEPAQEVHLLRCCAWIFDSSTSANPWRISNAASGTFASYTTAPAGILGSAERSSFCTHPNPITVWNFLPNGAGFNIQETTSGAVLTAWPFQPTLPQPTSPLTLDALDPSLARQVFTLATCEWLSSRETERC